MPVDYVVDGRERTAKASFRTWEHSGAWSEVPDAMKRALRDAGYGPSELEGGDTIVVADGELVVPPGPGAHPERVEGRSGPGGFGFGGLDAKLDILQRSYTADRSFVVVDNGAHPAMGREWVTEVDGEVVEQGEFRPFQIYWVEDGGGSGGTGFMRGAGASGSGLGGGML
jgi:hypothetical protein